MTSRNSNVERRTVPWHFALKVSALHIHDDIEHILSIYMYICACTDKGLGFFFIDEAFITIIEISFFCKLKGNSADSIFSGIYALFEFSSFVNISYTGTFALLKQFLSASHFNLLNKIECN